MLFDERDFNILETTESKEYFKEILQLYYNHNYRSAIVMLYSFVVYDLFLKLQMMATEGNEKAGKKLKEINTMISDDEKYSNVEKAIISYFEDNCELYFKNFIDDIKYLTNCRNNCAHLKVNDNSLFTPKDYQVRMLICSMFDNIFSVKAPFLMDIFKIAQTDIELYNSQIYSLSPSEVNQEIVTAIKNKYLIRMTDDSIKKSYSTFLKLLCVVNDEDCVSNIKGIYIFLYTMSDYILTNSKLGLTTVITEEKNKNIISKITTDDLKNYDSRKMALISLMISFPVIMDMIKGYPTIFEFFSNDFLSTPKHLSYYSCFYPRGEVSKYQFFLGTSSLKNPVYVRLLYEELKDDSEFSLESFLEIMVDYIPNYNGFYSADCFMSFLLEHKEEISIECIKKIWVKYKSNPQCKNRAKHSEDIKALNEFLGEDNKLS